VLSVVFWGVLSRGQHSGYGLVAAALVLAHAAHAPPQRRFLLLHRRCQLRGSAGGGIRFPLHLHLLLQGCRRKLLHAGLVRRRQIAAAVGELRR